MPWVQRDKRRYYYQPIKTPENQYRMHYAGATGSQSAVRAEKEDHHKRAQKALRQQGNKEIASLLDEFDTLRAVTDVITRARLLLTGKYFRRSELREIRRTHAEYSTVTRQSANAQKYR
jgi:hypothetical protein